MTSSHIFLLFFNGNKNNTEMMNGLYWCTRLGVESFMCGPKMDVCKICRPEKDAAMGEMQ